MATSPFAANAITIQLDYSHDDSGFFAVDSQQRAVLETAASYVGDLFMDDLDAIEPDVTSGGGQGNQWEAEFQDPSDSSNALFNDFLTVPADTLVVYAGGYNFPIGTLAQAGFGGTYVSGTEEFLSTVSTRGESGTTAGASADEIAPWGGFLSADTDTVWDFSLDGSTLDTDEYHFYSVMLHELVHIFGIGTADSWSSLLSGSTFTGTETTAIYGSAVPTTGDDHFSNSVAGEIFGTSTEQTASLAQSIGTDETRFLTDIDIAALDDIGWDVILAPVPEPSSASLLLICAGIAFTRRKR